MNGDLQQELFLLRKKCSETERKFDHFKLLYEESARSGEEMKLKVAQLESAKEKHSQLQLSYSDIKREYESSLAFSNDLSR